MTLRGLTRLLCLVPLLGAVWPALASTPAGTVLHNQALATYFDPLSGTVEQRLSNVSRVVVAAVRAVSLQADITLPVTAGQPVNLSHVLTNTGNLPDRYQLTVSHLAADTELLAPRVHLDNNGNGKADPGEPALTESPPLLPGESVMLVLAGTVPGAVNNGDQMRLQLKAVSLADAAVEAHVADTLNVGSGAFITLNKSASQACSAPLSPGDTLRYSISWSNIGNAAPAQRSVLVDGQPWHGVLIEDQLPGNLSLLPGNVSGLSPIQAVPLVHRAGDPADQWQRYDQWQQDYAPDRFAVWMPAANMAQNQSGGFSFAVRLNHAITAGASFSNTATVDLDGDGIAEFSSNTVCNTVRGNALPEIDFLRPANAVIQRDGWPAHGVDADFQRATLYALVPEPTQDVLRDGVYVQLSAAQLNRLPGVPDTLEHSASGERLILVHVSSRLTGDSVQVAMRETAPNSGLFRSNYPIMLSEMRSGGGGICPASATLAQQPLYHGGTRTSDAIAQGCVLRSGPEDRLTARYAVAMADGSGTREQVITAAATVDPAGLVFDASNGQPVPGAQVQLYQSRQPLNQYSVASCNALPDAEYQRARHPVTGAELPTASSGNGKDGTTGQYRYPYLDAGYCYYMDVAPPSGFSFPSAVAPEAARMFHGNVTDSSYGRHGFQVAAGRAGSLRGAFLPDAGNLPVNIPLDPAANTVAGQLVLTKEAEQSSAAVGDVIRYRINLGSGHAAPLYAGEIIDTLPYGFRYVPRSAWLEVDGERIAIPEPAGAAGQKIFSLRRVQPDGTVTELPLQPGKQVTLHYALRLSAGAVDSSGLNRAVAQARTLSGFVYQSNEDQVRVSVRREGVLSDKAMVFGKIYVDSNCDNLQSDGEWPIGGVKLYMQDGTWVITDENGQYSIYGLEPGLHTIKVDPLTLPEGVQLKPIDNRHAADPGSRFVDLVPGEYHRADFAAVCPPLHQSSALFKALQARNQSIDGSWMLDEAARFDPMRSSSSAAGSVRQAGSDGDLGSGIYTSGNRGGHTINDAWQRIAQPAPVAALESEQESEPDGAAANRETMPATEAVAEQITREQGQAGTWLWPRDGISRDGRFQAVVRAGLAPVLLVNGEPVPDNQLGEQVLNRSENVEVVSWYGVSLREGQNQLEIAALDAFGNRRVLARGEFVRPGSQIHQLKLVPLTDQFSADGGRSVVPVQVRLLDDNGYPVSGVQFVTLENDMGQWLEPDIQTDTSGHQVRVQDGEALVHLRSTEYTGTIRLRARLEQLTAQARVEQIAPMRPLVATGFVQLRGTVSQVDDNGGAPGNLALDDDGIDGRAALFIKGEVRGNAHLTLAYDTDKRLDEEDEVRRDLNPADFYPIPGDASVRGYDAQSRSKLYARLEKGRHSIMWGDYLTDSQQEFLDLGRVQRTVTGVNAVYDTGSTRVQLFGARPELEQMTEELRGNGTALLYRLSNRPARDSESVEIVVRDRNNPGLVLSSRALTRYVDYSVNYFTGDIRFHEVIPSLDNNFNPVSVRIHYNVDGQRDSYNFLGVRLQQQLTDRFGIGLASTRDEHQQDGFGLHSISADYRIGERTRLHASAAHMGHENGDPAGNAVSIDVQHAWEQGSSTELRWARAQEGFDNPAGGISEAREELRLAHRQQLGGQISVTAEGMHSEQLDGDDRQSSLGLIAEQQFQRHALRVGARGIEQRESTDSDRFGTWIVGASRNSSLLGKPLQIGADFEQAFRYSDRRRIAADADLQMTSQTSLYSRYELIDSLAGINHLNSDARTRQFTFGVRSALTRNTDVFSEYRMRGAVDGSDVAAANGVRSDLEITPGLTITPSLEWIETLQGGRSQDATAMSVGIEDKRNENRRTLARVESRFGDGREYYGLSAANIWRVTSDWSAVVRDDLRLQFTHGQAKEGDNIVTVGLAHRPRRNNRHHMLYMYKWKEHWGGVSGLDRTVHMFSTHHNYQAHDDWIFSGRVGGKWQATDVGTTTAHTDAWVMDGRIIWDITRRFDLDIHAGVLATEGTREMRHSFGIGVNALVRRNLRMGIGFNVVGFRDDDLDPEGYNAHGLYIGLEYKFDENDLGWLGSKAAGQRSYMGAGQ